MPTQTSRRTVLTAIGAATGLAAASPVASQAAQALTQHAAGAALSGLATASRASGAPIDPIFAAIQAHRETFHAFDSASAVLTDAIWYEQQIKRGIAPPFKPGTPKAHEEYNRLVGNVDDAFCELIDTAPSTAAGIIAMLHYVAELEGRGLMYGNDHFVDDDGKGRPVSWFVAQSIARGLGVQDA